LIELKKGNYLAVLDMDGVLTTNRSSWKIIHDTLGTDNRVNYNLYLSGKISYREFMLRDIDEWLKAKPDITREFILSIVKRIELRDGLLNFMERLNKSGFITAIVSGGLYILAELLNQKVSFDEIYANQLLFDSSGRLLRDGNIMVIPTQKGINVKDLQKKYSIPKEKTVSIGDTLNDFSMFTESHYSILLNPEENNKNPYGKTIFSESLLGLEEDILWMFGIE
jgi:phosphoserine phosphatase